MAAISDLTQYKSLVSSNNFYFFSKASGTTLTAFACSGWTFTPNAGAVPTTSIALNADSTGALFNQPVLSGSASSDHYLSQYELSNTTGIMSYILIDRLNHSGGLLGNSQVEQTVNLPSATLTRYTTGEGVMAALQIWTAIGTTGLTATIKYTNQAGTANQISKPIVLGSTNYAEANRFLIFPLADGDTGVRSVESFTFGTATSTAGNMGIVLFKPLLMLPFTGLLNQSIQSRSFDAILSGFGIIPDILPNACLDMIIFSDTSSSGVLNGSMNITEI